MLKTLWVKMAKSANANPILVQPCFMCWTKSSHMATCKCRCSSSPAASLLGGICRMSSQPSTFWGKVSFMKKYPHKKINCQNYPINMRNQVLICSIAKKDKTALLGYSPQVDGNRYTSPALGITKLYKISWHQGYLHKISQRRRYINNDNMLTARILHP